MKYYLFNDYKSKKLNKSKVLKTTLITSLIVAFAVLFCFYITNEDFRGFCNKYILKREIRENTGSIINISRRKWCTFICI